jgi:hypothetical protein
VRQDQVGIQNPGARNQVFDRDDGSGGCFIDYTGDGPEYILFVIRKRHNLIRRPGSRTLSIATMAMALSRM